MSRGIGINVPCEWCQSEAEKGEQTVYWELPDGTRAVEITNVPSVICSTCGMIYSSDEVTKEIEDQLLLVDTKKITKTIKYNDLMTLPRLLKWNYFDFTS
ncbi:MAG: YokU family protein [Bacillota bacterium]